MTPPAVAASVRRICAEDIGALAEELGWPVAGVERRWQEVEAGEREMIVAEVGQAPVGSVSINSRDDVPGLLHLFALDVASKHQRKSIGTMLIARVEDEARNRGLGGVWLDVAIENEGARRLYERLGYVRVGSVVVNRWTDHRPDGSAFDVEETCFRMLKHFSAAVSL